MKLGAHMIPCRTCTVGVTFACIDETGSPVEADGFHALRTVDVEMLNTQLEDKIDGDSRWHLARPPSPGGVIFVHDGSHLGSPDVARTFMARGDHDAERLSVLLERSDRIADSMREAGYFSRGGGGLFSGGEIPAPARRERESIVNELKPQPDLRHLATLTLLRKSMIVDPITHCGTCPYVDDGSNRVGEKRWSCHAAHEPGDIDDAGESIIDLGPDRPGLPPDNCPLREQPRLVMFATWEEVKRG
jgi:hypothetical protein